MFQAAGMIVSLWWRRAGGRIAIGGNCRGTAPINGMQGRHIP